MYYLYYPAIIFICLPNKFKKTPKIYQLQYKSVITKVRKDLSQRSNFKFSCESDEHWTFNIIFTYTAKSRDFSSH